LPYHDGGDRVAPVDIDAIASWTIDGECQRRCGDFEYLPGIDAPYAQVERALRHLDLRDSIVQVENFNAGVRPQADGCAAHLKFRAGIAIGPEAIATDQRTIAHHAEPVALASRRVAHLALGMGQARHTLRGVSIGCTCGRRCEERKQHHARKGN